MKEEEIEANMFHAQNWDAVEIVSPLASEDSRRDRRRYVSFREKEGERGEEDRGGGLLVQNEVALMTTRKLQMITCNDSPPCRLDLTSGLDPTITTCC